MPIGARRVSGLVITAVIAGTITASGLTAAVAAPECRDSAGLKGKALTSCLSSLRQQAESAGRTAALADEAYLQIKARAEDAQEQAEELDSAADRAALEAARSRARAGAVAAQLARTGGPAGQTTSVLLSGDGATQVLYHLSRMSELTEGTSTLAADAAGDQRTATDLSDQAALAVDRLTLQRARAKDAYETAKKASQRARLLVAKAEERQSPGSNAANIQSYKDLPSDASVSAKVLAFARAQIGEPYVFGAAGPGSWDCSGLTMGAFASTGRDIGGHGATVQYTTARSRGLLVPYGQAQPGDLLFYTAGGGDMYHVAIYSGSGMMVEAARPGTRIREVAVRTGELFPMVARFTG